VGLVMAAAIIGDWAGSNMADNRFSSATVRSSSSSAVLCGEQKKGGL
jgi:hypothetical protein